jgi:hypothetical protein
MKAANNLLYKIHDIDNIHLDFWKARKGKNGINYVEKYREYLTYNSIKLASEITSGVVNVGKYSFFKVFDPKERLICAADFSERVLQHAISYCTNKGKGVPVGNLCSQNFTNHYLAISDHYVKEQLKIKAYVRYMDDMVLWGNDQKQLIENGRLLEQFLLDKLKLKLKFLYSNQTRFGLSFLGYVIFKDKIHLNKNSRKRFSAKLKAYNKKLKHNEWTENEYQKHILPLLAFA